MTETKLEIKVGRVYRAKKPRGVCVGLEELYNDRMVLYKGAFDLQYDSPTVKPGQRYKKCPIEKFVKWAGEDVTDKLPKGEWEIKIKGTNQ